MQNTPKREVLHSPGARICTGAKGRSRDRSNEDNLPHHSRTDHSSWSGFVCKQRCLTTRRRKMQEERRNQFRRRKMVIAYAIARFLLIVFALDVPWAKDTLPAWKRNFYEKNQKDRRATPFVKEDKETLLLPITKVMLKLQLLSLNSHD